MRYKIGKQILWKVVDDEVVIVDTKKDAYSYLNKTGKDIWEGLANGSTVEEIVVGLMGRYEGTAEKIEGETKALIRELSEAGLIEEKRG